jgi:3-methylcrotonyl-CoA carboxylase alpha subunit
MFDKILIANRGEIACRIAETAHRLGIATVAVYSDADRDARHVAFADEAVRLGTGPATDSYLAIEKIIAAAISTGAQAIHPGYGFLAENPDFAAACGDAGLVFIGPSPEAMRALGGKAEAKRIAEKAGVPVVPGYQGEAQDAATLASEARKIGYPVMIKAVAGGGGRGMRLVTEDGAFADALESAAREAASAFGDPRVLIEKCIIAPRHIEVQVFGDSHGNAVHMFERDCTLQRRNQKVIEEAPAPGMSPGLRAGMTAAATALAKSVGYEGAGTIEFLVEGGELGEDARWYFIEMNTRLQVEHPVTEQITGLDLVEWQLRVAAGEPLPCTQDDITMRGHAIEARVCAEDPSRDFAPSIGKIYSFYVEESEDLRVETGVNDGSEISPFYDSLIAKLIVTGEDRQSALDGLAEALSETEILGLRTNVGFLHALLVDEDVAGGRVFTGLIAEKLDRLVGPAAIDLPAVAAGVKALLAADRRLVADSTTGRVNDPWDAGDGFRLGANARLVRPVMIDGAQHDAEFIWHDDALTVCIDGETATTSDAADLDWPDGHGDAIHFSDEPVARAVDRNTAFGLRLMRHHEISWPRYDSRGEDDNGGTGAVRAPINGRIAKIHVAEGQTVEENQPVAVVEAMKMEHVLAAPRSGVVERIAFSEGDQVGEGAVIVALAEEDGG